MREPYVTVSDLKREYGWSQSWIYKAIDVYKLPSYKLGGKRVFLMSEINQWCRERKEIHAS